MSRSQNDESNGDRHTYGRRAAEALDVALVLDQSIHMLIMSETNQVSRDQITQVRLLALRNKETFIDEIAEVYARHYSLDELKAVVAFLESPVGKTMREKQPHVEGEMRLITMGFLQKIMDEAN